MWQPFGSQLSSRMIADVVFTVRKVSTDLGAVGPIHGKSRKEWVVSKQSINQLNEYLSP